MADEPTANSTKSSNGVCMPKLIKKLSSFYFSHCMLLTNSVSAPRLGDTREKWLNNHKKDHFPQGEWILNGTNANGSGFYYCLRSSESKAYHHDNSR